MITDDNNDDELKRKKKSSATHRPDNDDIFFYSMQFPAPAATVDDGDVMINMSFKVLLVVALNSDED